MKNRTVAVALLTMTAAVVAAYPSIRQGILPPQVALDPVVSPLTDPLEQHQRIEVVFALDTTGSMSGLINAAKEKIWSIASSMASANSAPEISMGLVAYRDRGDAYVTRVHDLSTDLDSMYASLMDFRAEGGGDGPESVNQALFDAVNKVSWSDDSGVYRVIFLVGDAPPHMDYQDDVKYPVTISQALHKGIVINTIQAGNDAEAGRSWQTIAAHSSGKYFQVEQSGNAIAMATPFDEELAELSNELDATRLAYGDAAQKRAALARREATQKMRESSSVETQARRAAFNVSPSGKANLVGDNDLVEDVVSGGVALEEIEAERLPEPMQAMSADERQAAITEMAEQRRRLQEQMRTLSARRADYLEKKVAEAGVAEASLDGKIYSAIREQATGKGFDYSAPAPAY